MATFDPPGPEVFDTVRTIRPGFVDEWDELRQIAYGDVERLLVARRPRDFEALPLLTCRSFFEPAAAGMLCADPDAQAGDLAEMQRVMLGALDLVRAANDDRELAQGRELLEIVSLDGAPGDRLAAVNRAFALLVLADPSRAQALAECRDGAVCSFVSVRVDAESAPAYAGFLRRVAESSGCWTTHEVGRDLVLARTAAPESLFPATERGRRSCVRFAVDEIMTLHLQDVRTVTVDGGRESRRASTGAAYSWWLLVDHMRDGRVGVCEGCGRPYVANVERGNPRRFCSKKCQMRALRRRKGQTPPNGGLDGEGDAT